MSWKAFGQAVARGWSEHQISSYAGSLAFSAILALFPFLIFVIALAGLVISPQQIEALLSEVRAVAPPDVTKIVGQEIERMQGGAAALLTVGVIGSIWAASGGAASAMTALNETYGVRDQRPFWKIRGIAVLSTVLVAGLVLVAILVFVVAAPLSDVLGEPLGTAVLWLRWPVSGFLVMFALALLYYLLPDVEQKFQFITPGSVAATAVWLLASFGFTEYVTHFGNYSATYGALGGVVVLLLWMYISSVVFLLGSEVNAIVEHESDEGKRAGVKKLADSGRSAHFSSPSQPSGASRADRPGGSGDQAVAPVRRPRGGLGLARTLVMAIGMGAGIAAAMRRRVRT
jgi:membrane protein